MQEKKKSILLKGILVLCVVAMLPLFAGFGTKLGFWEPITGFRMTMNYMTISSIAAIVFLFLLLYKFTDCLKNTITYTLATLLIFGSGYYLGINKEPPDLTGVRGIHDVSTDTINPPKFVALLEAPGRRNDFFYDGNTRMRQLAKFPWVKPIMSELTPNDAYERAVSIANQMGWDLTGVNAEELKFEATDYTKWFNFNDDLVVRVTATEQGSRIDLRSL
ncbi:MAG: DUF1499 domain-containing protein, partial [Emcibacteraceae bacterium]|nr:DUF1499 domain-containing protein [Emcibacteraceae bacterium]